MRNLLAKGNESEAYIDQTPAGSVTAAGCEYEAVT